MNTFLTYLSFAKSLNCLDDLRLGNQRNEASTIEKVNEQGPEIAFVWDNSKNPPKKILLWHQPLDSGDGVQTTPWYNHPAVRIWRGFEAALESYKNIAIATWVARGFKNNMEFTYKYNHSILIHSPWWLTEEFCAAHRSNLLRKQDEADAKGIALTKVGQPYSYYDLGWTEPNDLPYIWPV